MKINDYEFLYNIDALFEKKIIIYGAGIDGRQIYKFLQKISITAEFFCDRNPLALPSLPAPVISIDELRKKTQVCSDYFIILGSYSYFEDMLSELEKKQIEAYICTWSAVRFGIELNIEDGRFPEQFKKDFQQQKKIWNQNHALYHPVMWRMKLSRYPDVVYVYQVGKVGSSTIVRTLEHENIGAVHFHRLTQRTGVPQIDDSYEYFREKFHRDGARIISLVREPITRALSDYMQGFSEFVLYDRCTGSNIETEATQYIANSLMSNEEFEWFDREIKTMTGVDVYQYPFDKQQGYAWIKEGKTEILLLKLESLNQNVDKIGEFVGKTGIKLVDKNVGAAKMTKYIYQQLKNNVKIPVSAVQKQYENNPKFDHFYSEQEKQTFLKKWEANIIG